MSTIGVGKGSEWHLLRYLGYHRAKLAQSTTTATGGQCIDWIDLESARSPKPLHDDSEWRAAEFLRNPTISPLWKTYWPSSGSPQSWDAVGKLNHHNGTHDWLMVEAKAHVGEISSKCGATVAGSVSMIRAAFDDTATHVTGSGVITPAWLDTYYQYSNRLAVLNFLLNKCTPSIPARLVFIYFCGERATKMRRCDCPASEADWQPHLAKMKAALDLDPQSPLMQRVHHVFLPVNP